MPIANVSFSTSLLEDSNDGCAKGGRLGRYRGSPVTAVVPSVERLVDYDSFIESVHRAMTSGIWLALK